MKKSKVYWAHNSALAYNDVVGYPLERLLTVMKRDPFFKQEDTYGSILRCPATLEQIKNTYTMRSPMNMSLQRRGDGMVELLPVGFEYHPHDYIQLEKIIGFYLFSESPVKMSVTPPFLHPNSFSGGSGEYDISKWFRQAHPSLILETKRLDIKRGQVLAYVNFDRPVELYQYAFTTRLHDISGMTASAKTMIPKLSLSYIYNRFLANQANKLVMKEIRNNLL